MASRWAARNLCAQQQQAVDIELNLNAGEAGLLLHALFFLLGFLDFAFADFVAFAHERTPVGLADSLNSEGRW